MSRYHRTSLSSIFITMLIVVVMAQMGSLSSAFAPQPTTSSSSKSVLSRTTTTTKQEGSCIDQNRQRGDVKLQMGIFDAISKAFENTEYGPPAESVKASAKHILVPTEGEAKVVMKMITTNELSFEDCAREFSTCPSSSKGGSLGSFSPGTMVPEFDKVVFDPETKVGDLKGPIMTDFGFHVIVVEKRTGGGDWY